MRWRARRWRIETVTLIGPPTVNGVVQLCAASNNLPADRRPTAVRRAAIGSSAAIPDHAQYGKPASFENVWGTTLKCCACNSSIIFFGSGKFVGCQANSPL